MLTIRDLTGTEEGLTDFKELTRNRKVNGEKTLSLTVLPTTKNKHSFSMVEEESIITFEGEEYVIKKLSERAIGNTYIKRAEAIHKFYVDMINKQQPNIHDGSMTFSDFLSFVFQGTGYTFSIIDTFYAQTFENLGNDNRLALLQKGLERYKAEMEIIGSNVRFKAKIGNDTDFQFRYGHNIIAIEKSVDTTNLSTVIQGKGAEGITASYRSPNADIFGDIDAPPVEDERFTTQASLLTEMKARLEDTPEFSIAIDFADLRAAGYPWTVPNEGDNIFVIYEHMNDLLVDTRILEINEQYDLSFIPRKTRVTLANFKKTFAGTLFNNVQKQLRNIVNDDGIIRYNVLDEAVRIATEALQSAQTELEFQNGIIARDPSNPNNLVLFTSAGIGVSRDGGATFKEALTYQGLVASVGVVGQFAANNIQIGQETMFESGYDPSTKETPTGAQEKADAVGQDVRNDLRLIAPLPTSLTLNQNGITASTTTTDKYARLDYRGLFVKKGAIQIERPDGYNTIIDGMVNQDFNVQGATPPFTVDTEILGRYFKTNMGSQSPGICQVFTFKKSARYLKFHVGIATETAGNQARAFVEQTGVPGVWLGSATGTELLTNGGEEKWITVDLGVPDGTDFAVYLKLFTNTVSSGAFVRVIRAFLTDF